MTPNRVTLAMEKYSGSIPRSSAENFRTRLQNASDDCFDVMMQAHLKGKVRTVLFSIFLGGIGVDRFYLGDTGLGIFKIISNILAYVLLLIPILGFLLVAARSIWGFVDIFLCYKKAKQLNYNILVGCLFDRREDHAV